MANTYSSRLREGLGRNTSLISLTLILNIYNRVVREVDYFQPDDIPDDDFVPNFSLNSFTLTINDFSIVGDWDLGLGVLLFHYKSLTTLNLTFKNVTGKSDDDLRNFFNVAMKVNSLSTLRLKINDSRFGSGYRGYDFSELVVENPSLELIELTITCYGVESSLLQTLKWEKQ